jgi:hypothetical protein
MLEIIEERGMDFASVLHPHKKPGFCFSGC